MRRVVPRQERGKTMSGIDDEQAETSIISTEISDEALEAAASAGAAGIYAQIAWCTFGGCPL